MDAVELLEGFFAPKSVLVVGVSTSPRNLARNIVYNLIEFRFPGPFYLLGTKPGYVFGHPIRTSFAELPEGITLAVILTPAATVPAVLEECGKKGIRFAVIQSGGFSELGEEGEVLEKSLREVASRYGIRFIGPNCLGVLSPPGRLGALFMPLKDYWRHGGVSIAAQSGGVGVTYLYGLASENIGLSRFASIGNKADVDETDLLLAFDADPETKVIALYLESINRGREFFEALRRCTKPVLVHKANRTPKSQAIAFSHTAALTTDDAVVDAALRQAGAVRVKTMQEMLARIKALMLPRAQGPRLAVIARSGGHAVIAADAAADAGFDLPPYPRHFLESVEGSFASKVIRRGNPLDLGDLYDFDAYARILEGAAALKDFDAVLMVHEYFAVIEGEESRKLIPKAQELARLHGKPVVLVLVTDERETAQIKRLYDYPFYTCIEDALMALGEAMRAKARPATSEAARKVDVSSAAEKVRSLAKQGRAIAVAEGFEILKACGISVPDYVIVKNEEGLADWTDFPAAAKVVSAKAVHKTEAGGVYLNVNSEDELVRVVRELRGRFGPFGEGEGVLVQRMVKAGTEWIVGAKRDKVFGPIVLVGAGGIFVELLRDTCIRLGPVSLQEAQEMIGALRARPLLDGVRNVPPGDAESLAQCIATVSFLMDACPEIEEIDLNPCIVSQSGTTVVDVRIRLRPSDKATSGQAA